MADEYLLNLMLVAAVFLAGQRFLLLEGRVFALTGAALMTLGGYTSATLSAVAGWPPAAAVVAAAAATAGAAAAAGGILVNRLRSDYLALASLGLAHLTYVTLRVAAPGGAAGLAGVPPLAGGAAGLCLHAAAAAAAVGLFEWLRRTRFGAVLAAAGEDEDLVRGAGQRPGRVRVEAFALAAAAAGLAGALQAHFLGVVEPRAAALPATVLAVAVTVVAGAAGWAGPAVGAVLWIGAPLWLQAAAARGGWAGWWVYPALNLGYGAALVGMAFALSDRFRVARRREAG